MSYSLRPKYYQVGAEGKHALYPVTDPESRNLPFRFDNIDPEEIAEEYLQEETDLGVLSDKEVEES